MPLKPGAPIGETIKEFKTGDHYQHTLHKFGADRARKQAIAVAIQNSQKRASGGRVNYPKIGLAENPAGVPFHCPSCRFFENGYCGHKDPQLHGKKVTARHCCDLYEHTGMKVIVK